MSKILIIGASYESPSQYYAHRKLISSLQDQGIKITFACESTRNLEGIVTEDAASIPQVLRALKAFFHLLSHAGILNKDFDYESFREDSLLNIPSGLAWGQRFLSIDPARQREIVKKIRDFETKYPSEGNLIKFITKDEEIGWETINKIFQSNLISKLPIEQRLEICKLASEKGIQSFAMESSPLDAVGDFGQAELIKLEPARIKEMSTVIHALYTKALQDRVNEVVITFDLGMVHSRRLQAELLRMGVTKQDVECLLLIGSEIGKESGIFSEMCNLPSDGVLKEYFREAQEIRCKALLDLSDFSVKPDKSTREAIDGFVKEFVKSVKPEVKGVASRCVAMALAEKLPKLAEAIRNSR